MNASETIYSTSSDHIADRGTQKFRIQLLKQSTVTEEQFEGALVECIPSQCEWNQNKPGAGNHKFNTMDFESKYKSLVVYLIWFTCRVKPAYLRKKQAAYEKGINAYRYRKKGRSTKDVEGGDMEVRCTMCNQSFGLCSKYPFYGERGPTTTPFVLFCPNCEHNRYMIRLVRGYTHGV